MKILFGISSTLYIIIINIHLDQQHFFLKKLTTIYKKKTGYFPRNYISNIHTVLHIII